MPPCCPSHLPAAQDKGSQERPPCNCCRSSLQRHRSPPAQHTWEWVLEALRHAPLARICREAGDQDRTIPSSSQRPPSAPQPPQAPRAQPARGGKHEPVALQGEQPRCGTRRHPRGRILQLPILQLPSGKAAGTGGRETDRESSTPTHSHTKPGANLQSRNASPCQELGSFPPSSRLAAPS